MRQPRISVVMAVYNGRQYIAEQIESIKTQSLRVDEIIIIDDCSDEKSTDIISACFSGTSFHIKYMQHTCNAGYAQTFFEALRNTNGEFVFFADQDDIWESYKVEKCIDILTGNPQISCLSACNTLIDSEGHIIKKERSPRKHLMRITKKRLIKQTGLRPGMTLVIRRKIKQKLDTINTKPYESHDRLVEYLSTLDDGFFLLGEHLTRYRIHEKNTSGLNLSHNKLRSGIEGRLAQIDKEVRYLRLLSNINSEDSEMINRYIQYFQTRKKLLEDRNPMKYIIGSMKIIYGYCSSKIWFGDLLCIIKENR